MSFASRFNLDWERSLCILSPLVCEGSVTFYTALWTDLSSQMEKEGISMKQSAGDADYDCNPIPGRFLRHALWINNKPFLATLACYELIIIHLLCVARRGILKWYCRSINKSVSSQTTTTGFILARAHADIAMQLQCNVIISIPSRLLHAIAFLFHL